MPAGQNFSRKHRGREELIDHILVSAALVKKLSSVRALVDEGVPSITEDPASRRAEPSSDHAPVVAAFGLES